MKTNTIKDIVILKLTDLTLPERNAKVHTDQQVMHIINSIEEFGMNDPIGVWGDKNIIVEGAGRWEACKRLAIESVPCIRLDHLTADARRAYALAHNLTQAETGFDLGILKLEVEDLDFSFAELGLNLDLDVIKDKMKRKEVSENDIPAFLKNPNEIGLCDVFEIGGHRLICGDSTVPEHVSKLMDGALATMIMTDPPYNLSADKITFTTFHTNFVEGAGELSERDFTLFLSKITRNLYDFSVDGSIHYIWMDWRHIEHLLVACKIYEKFKALCVWNKNTTGLGTFYHNKHELCFVYKKGKAKHINNFGFGGASGRFRANVWDYHGQSSADFAKTEGCERVHPTMKPVEMLREAIFDCSNICDIVLDLFGGSGSTMVACEQAKRCCFMCEKDAKYVNVILRRMVSTFPQLEVKRNGVVESELWRVE